jgi:flagellar basal-body rod modification protein FlgD
MPTTVNPYAALNAGAAGVPAKTKNEAGAEDRFLKLLVAQMSNQDPLNPMDNAQVTSQMAQINTVNGIEKLNRTVEGLNLQFVQMQALQGAALVGRDVIVAGDRLAANDAGLVQGGFELASPADSVKVEVLNAGGRVIDTVDLGATGSGRHGFEWTPPAGVDATLGERFRVVAKSGAAAVPATLLMRDRVDAVATGGDSLTLELRLSGNVAYSQIKAFN